MHCKQKWTDHRSLWHPKRILAWQRGASVTFSKLASTSEVAGALFQLIAIDSKRERPQWLAVSKLFQKCAVVFKRFRMHLITYLDLFTTHSALSSNNSALHLTWLPLIRLLFTLTLKSLCAHQTYSVPKRWILRGADLRDPLLPWAPQRALDKAPIYFFTIKFPCFSMLLGEIHLTIANAMLTDVVEYIGSEFC